MRGFTDSGNPVWLHVSATVQERLGASGPFQIDGASAERDTDGLIVTVAETRYFIPMNHVVMVTQEQENEGQPQAPVAVPGANGDAGSNGQGEGRKASTPKNR